MAFTWKRSCGRDVKHWHNRCLCGVTYNKMYGGHQQTRGAQQQQPRGAAAWGPQRPRSQSAGKQPDVVVQSYIRRLPPMPHRAARTHSAHRTPPTRQTEVQSFKKELHSQMEKLASLAIMAKKANKGEDADRHDMELMVLKSALNSLNTIRDQKKDVNFKLDKAKDQLSNAMSRMQSLADQQQEIEMEIAQLESCLNELNEMPEE
ncbi:unnamed protein product, partial [Prorocentrum cordatum]